MNSATRRSARINVRVLVILILVIALVGGAAVGGYYVRKRTLAAAALRDGRQALAQGDYAQACRHLNDYLQRYPTDEDVLREYADANLEVVPLEPIHVGSAIGAYRRLLRYQPQNDHAYRRLAALYIATNNHSELRHLARQRLSHLPGEPAAVLWLTTALLAQGQDEDAVEPLESLVAELDGRPEHRGQLVDASLQRSEIALRAEKSDSEQEALHWLNRAAEAELPLAFARRALFFRTRREPLDGISLAQLAERARADLQRADDLEPRDPRVRLLLSQEWMAHGEFSRAEVELAATENLSAEALREFFLRPADWETLLFSQQVELALRRGEPERALPVAREMLAERSDPRRRLAILPSAIELFTAAGELDEAEEHLAELRDHLLVQGRGSRYEETPALLAAMIADTRGDHYAVITRLAPFADAEVTRPKIYSLLARALIETGQHRRAIRVLRQYLNREPDDRPAALQLVRQFLRVRAWTEAVETAQWASRRWPESADVALTSAEARVRAIAESPVAGRQLDLGRLERDLNRLREQLPSLVDVALLQAEFHRAERRPDQAREVLQAAVDRCDEPLPARMMLVELLSAEGKTAEAIASARRIRDDHPEEQAVWRLLADLHVADGDITAARETLDQGLAEAPTDQARRTLATHRALVDLLHGAESAAIDRLQRLADADPRDAHVRSLLLDIPEVRHNTELATRLISELRELEGENGVLWRVHEAARLLADEEAWRTHQNEIQNHLEACLNASPGWQTPALLLADLHLRTDSQSQAEGVYRRTLASNATATRVGEALLQLLERESRFDEAREVVDQLEQAAPVSPARRARLSLQEGAWREAMDYLDLHLRRNQGDPLAAALMARLIQRQTGDTEQALELLEGIEPTSSERLGVASARADILRKAGRLQEAIDVLDAAVGDLDNLAAYRLRADFLARAGRLDAAEEDYRRALQLSDDGKGHLALGSFYASTGRVEEAMQTLNAGFSEHPDHPDLRRALIDILLARGEEGDIARASELAQGSVGRAGPADLVQQARLVLQDATPEARRNAEQLLTRAVDQDASQVEAYLHLIGVAEERGDYSGAQQWATRGLGALPGHPRLLMARAHCEARLHNAHLALQLAKKALERRPHSPGLLLQYADVLLEVGDDADLAEALERFERFSGYGEQFVRRHARLLAANGRIDEAIRRLEDAIADPEIESSPELSLVLAEMQYRLGNLEKAGRLVRDTLAQSPDNQKLRRAAVIWHAERGQWDEIIALVENRPVDSLPAAQVANVAAAALGESGIPDHQVKAVQMLERVVDRFPGLTRPRLTLAYLCYLAGDKTRAESMYRDVLEIEPNQPRPLNDLAWLLAERGDYAEALELANRAIRLDPSNANIHDTRAIIYEGQDRLHEALVDRQRCVSLSGDGTPAQARALVKLAMVYEKLGEFDAAAGRLEEALAIDADLAVFDQEQKSDLHTRLATYTAGSR